MVAVGCSPVSSSDGTDAKSGETPAADAAADTYGEPAGADQVKQGGDLVMALSAEPDALDPTTSRSLYSRYVFNAMCEKLYDVDQKTAVVPQLAAELPEVSADGLTVTIPIRKGVTFADGGTLDAAAVKKSLERHLTMKASGRRSELGPITSIEATDPSTVTIHLSQPFSPLLGALTDRAGMILSPATLDKLGDKFSQAPACVGAFKFEERVPQTSIKLVKDPNYYNADQVHLDSITYRIITDSSIRAANLRSGDVQVADTLSTQDVGSLKEKDDITVLSSQSLGYQGVTFNVGNVDGVGTPAKPIDTPSANDPRIRQAFEYAVDRKGLVSVVFNNLYSPACSPISPATQFASEASNECAEHDPKKAKELLKEAGVALPYEITMKVSNNPDTLRLAQALQSMVKDSGFAVKVEPVEYASLLDLQDRGDFQMLQLGWSGRIDPDANITNFVGTGGSQNVSGYNNPKVDELLNTSRVASSIDDRRDAYAAAIKIVHDDAPIVYLYRLANLTGFTSAVAGVQVFPDGVVRLGAAGFVK